MANRELRAIILLHRLGIMQGKSLIVTETAVAGQYRLVDGAHRCCRREVSVILISVLQALCGDTAAQDQGVG